jgi:hypothetical protein
VPGLRRISSGIAILPMSCRNAPRAITLISAGVNPHGPRQCDGVCGYALGVPLGLGVLQVQRIAQRLQVTS